MSDQSVSLKLPEEIYERVRQIATDSNRSLENVLIDSYPYSVSFLNHKL